MTHSLMNLTRLATSEFVDRVRTSGAALTPDPAETSGQVMREPRTSATSASETSLIENEYVQFCHVRQTGIALHSAPLQKPNPCNMRNTATFPCAILTRFNVAPV